MKIIFVIGGVVSGIGKGICVSSIGTILKNSGKKVFIQKCDPYLNIDPGTMNPLEHGEVFVTKDGAETDLDLGHYERFIDESLTKYSNITAGKIYKKLLSKERNGDYIGKTIQVVPHVTNMIKDYIYNAFKKANCDVLIVEIGGTVGDIESLPFLEAIRQIRMELGKENVMFILVALLPYLTISKEFKTKPIQHSVKQLLSTGIQADMIIIRSFKKTLPEIRKKIASFCNVTLENVIESYNVSSIYEVPKVFYDQNVHKLIANQFDWKNLKPNMKNNNLFIEKIHRAKKEVTIYLVGKYVELPDAYLSVLESLYIAGFENEVKVKVEFISSDTINKSNYESILKDAKGILVPGGFGKRGIDGMLLAAKYARENNIPYLGICLGMQIACIEFARNVLKIDNAHSLEFDDQATKIFTILEGKSSTKDLGGTLRLGDYKTTVLPQSLLSKLYKTNIFCERHRHRYEFNNEFRNAIEEAGLIVSGEYKEKNLVEVVELKNHKFFIGSQFHPEFSSRPNKPNPLFYGFIKAIIS